MRIHGIHVQGLKAPRGEHRLRFDSGYNVVVASDERAGAGLAALVRAFLFPRTDLGNLEIWGDPGAGQPARAGISLSFGREAYRLIVDLEKSRLVLGRYDTASERYERVSTDPDEIEACLHGAGLPTREEFMTLHLCEGTELGTAESEETPPAEGVAPTQEADPEDPRSRLVRELEEAESLQKLREEVERRVAELSHARNLLAPLEGDHGKLLEEIEKRSVLGGVMADLDPRLEHLRELEEERARERVAIEQSRREFLDERAELRGIPSRQVLPFWIGVVLAVLGTLAGLSGYPVFYLFGAAGAVTVGGALFVSRTARRRMGTVEACLAALRVRERTLERDFESESAQVRGAMQVLKLETFDELAREVADYRGLVSRAKEVEQEIEAARATFPEGAEEELCRLEKTLLDLADSPDPDPIREELASLPEPLDPPPPADAEPAGDSARDAEPPGLSDQRGGPDDFARAAALITGRTDQDIRERIRPTLPVYLRTLSAGAFAGARRRELEGWLLRGEQRGEVVSYDTLSEPLRSAVRLAFRLSVLEAIATDRCAPFILTPGLPLAHEEQKLALARAFRRLGSGVQVIQIAMGKGAWTEEANRELVLGT
jgi:hypothetical protein